MATAKQTATSKTTTPKTTARKPATTRTTAGTAQATGSTTVEAEVRSDQGRLSLGPIELPTVDVKVLATETAYATVGAGDRAIQVARELPGKLETARKERREQALARRAQAQAFIREAPAKAESFLKQAPAVVREVPTKVQAEITANLEATRKEIDSYASRGRKVVDSIAKAPATKRALDQTENARSQVKGAVTSIRKAALQGQEAVESATGRIGVRRSA